MNKLKKRYKLLYKYYNKSLKKITKNSVLYRYNCLSYLYVYLLYMRDYYILTSDNWEEDEQKINSLSSAIIVFNECNNCINLFYTKNSFGVLEQIDKSKTKEEVQKEYQSLKAKCWEFFWQIIHDNIESWFSIDDFNI